MKPIIDVVIPAYNEEQSIGLVLRDIPEWVRAVTVVDNASTDRTAEVAAQAGATVVSQPEKGYGAACLKGLETVFAANPPAEIIVFLDGDYSDHPEEMDELIKPILEGRAELVIGSRHLGDREKGSMTGPQVFGNWLATRMMRVMYKSKFTDLGPFRAVTREALDRLDMRDRNFGWTVEMQVKALKLGIPYAEVPVSYRRRIGVSKVSGTFRGAVSAGYKIITTILKHA